MKSYEAHGITDFIVCCGYKGEILKGILRIIDTITQIFGLN